MPVNPMKRCPVTVSNVPRQAVLYTRVSSKEQELGYSIPAQQELLRSYGAQLGLVIEQELSDAQTSTSTGRPWLAQPEAPGEPIPGRHLLKRRARPGRRPREVSRSRSPARRATET